jgi:hypothetical protein
MDFLVDLGNAEAERQNVGRNKFLNEVVYRNDDRAQ